MTEHEVSLAELVQDVVLPDWLQNELPEHKPIITIAWDGARYVAMDANGGREKSDDIEELYDLCKTDGMDVILDASLEGHGGNLMGGFFFCTVKEEAGTARLLLGVDDGEREALLKSSFKKFTELIHPCYLKDPNNWVNAYNWLQHHPAFWYRHDTERTFRWETDNGLKHLSIMVTTHEGEPVVMLEHGGHVAPEYTYHYHDFRLDVYASTFEDAYVRMAARVHEFFDIDGTERENVEHEKSLIEKDLEARITRLES